MLLKLLCEERLLTLFEEELELSEETLLLLEDVDSVLLEEGVLNELGLDPLVAVVELLVVTLVTEELDRISIDWLLLLVTELPVVAVEPLESLLVELVLEEISDDKEEAELLVVCELLLEELLSLELDCVVAVLTLL